MTLFRAACRAASRRSMAPAARRTSRDSGGARPRAMWLPSTRRVDGYEDAGASDGTIPGVALSAPDRDPRRDRGPAEPSLAPGGPRGIFGEPFRHLLRRLLGRLMRRLSGGRSPGGPRGRADTASCPDRPHRRAADRADGAVRRADSGTVALRFDGSARDLVRHADGGGFDNTRWPGDHWLQDYFPRHREHLTGHLHLGTGNNKGARSVLSNRVWKRTAVYAGGSAKRRHVKWRQPSRVWALHVGGRHGSEQEIFHLQQPVLEPYPILQPRPLLVE